MAPVRSFNEYIIHEKITKIIVYNSDNEKFETIIDTDNLDKLLELNKRWNLEWNIDTESYYVKTTIYLGIIDGKPKYRTLRLQNFLLNRKDNKIIDHINNNSLDNRKRNLRECNKSLNGMNRASKNSNNTSGYRNVSWISGSWRIQLQINGKNHLFPEKFSNVEEAGKFAEQMRAKYYGEFAGYN